MEIFSLIPHGNTIALLRGIQQKAKPQLLPFEPIFCPLYQKEVQAPAFLLPPVFDGTWLYCPITFPELSSQKNISIDSKTQINGFPPFPTETCIPLAFTLSAAPITFEIPESISSIIKEPLKLRVFKTTNFFFDWPLDEESQIELQNIIDKKSASINQDSSEITNKYKQEESLCFNYHIGKIKWHAASKKTPAN